MPAAGPVLLVLTIAAIALLLFLILVVKLHAFLAMLIASMALGLGAGMAPAAVLKSIQSGFGDALGFIAVVVGLGAMIGRYIEDSGGGRSLAEWLLQKFGRDRATLALFVAAYLVGLPLFFEVGFIILAPLVWSLTKESKRSLLVYGMPMTAALSATHSLVPPHPAPAAAAQLLGADLGRVILYGIAVSIPMAVAGGVFYGRWIAERVFVPPPPMADRGEPEGRTQAAPPHAALVALILIFPVLLIFGASLAGTANLPGKVWAGFFGHPFTALLIATLAAMIVFGARRGLDRNQIARLAVDSCAPIGTLLLMMGGGGAFKQVIVDSGAGMYAGKLLASSNISPLVVAFLVATVLRAAQGSATVAIITAAGIMAPLVKHVTGYRPEMIVLAVCCGGSMISHVNDAGFWIVNEYFGMAVPQTLKSWTVMKLVCSLVGFALVLAAQAVWG
ncbi:MAG TPA: gluconate:H+ symporter [Bryobacteraceae bacterium]|nr:gluconate:H+ symporter [Bryobacteraceae bacterium]